MLALIGYSGLHSTGVACTISSVSSVNIFSLLSSSSRSAAAAARSAKAWSRRFSERRCIRGVTESYCTYVCDIQDVAWPEAVEAAHRSDCDCIRGTKQRRPFPSHWVRLGRHRHACRRSVPKIAAPTKISANHIQTISHFPPHKQDHVEPSHEKRRERRTTVASLRVAQPNKSRRFSSSIRSRSVLCVREGEETKSSLMASVQNGNFERSYLVHLHTNVHPSVCLA